MRRIRTYKLANGSAIALEFLDDRIKIFYEEDKEKILKNMTEVKKWVKHHFKQEPACW